LDRKNARAIIPLRPDACIIGPAVEPEYGPHHHHHGKDSGHKSGFPCPRNKLEIVTSGDGLYELTDRTEGFVDDCAIETGLPTIFDGMARPRGLY
jgi:hypothetical protein